MNESTYTEPVTLSQQPDLSENYTSTTGIYHRRSTNACRRCKRRKIKCHYTIRDSHGRCAACAKSRSDCFFDTSPDGVLRGHAYIATLEAKIQTLKKQLHEVNYDLARERNRPSNNSQNTETEHRIEPDNLTRPDENVMELTPQPGHQSVNNERRTPAFDITVLDILHGKSFASDLEGEDVAHALPALPSSNRARELVDTVYFYTQARYCIIDWSQLREWHRDRETIAYTSCNEGQVSSQTGAFFIWIIYAIGACLVLNPENSTEAYFSRARMYLPAVIAPQNLTTVQALLCLVQYYFRAPNESPIWDLVGVVMRLCVKLRYHRKIADSPDFHNLDPYTIELQKRCFWCAFCFDRLASMLAKLPFGIGDLDIDVETPVDVDDTCTNQQTIRDLQLKQAAGLASPREGPISTMTAALHHLQIYRFRSKILTNFSGPHARVPSLNEVQRLLSELDQWRQRAPRKEDSRSFPQQNPDRIQANYLQAVLLLIRPILMSRNPDPNLIGLCVEFAADACEGAKVLSLNPQTLPDRITVYHCFYGGITLLQCLVIKPTALTPRRIHRAISACLSALAVYTRVLPAVVPFLQLFEDISSLFLCDDHESEVHTSPRVQNLLNRIISSDPSETSGILRSMSHSDNQYPVTTSTPQALEGEELTAQYDSILGGQSSVVPTEMPLDISPLYAPDAEIMDLWTGLWMDTSSTEIT